MVDLSFGEGGLIPAIVQDRLTGQIRMLAYANREALARTLETGRATFFSRSRGEIWEKGATSGNTIHVTAVVADCDADAVLYLSDPAGPTCHTGSPSCFFRRVGADGTAAESGVNAAAFLTELEREIEARKASTGAKSYTRYLLDGGAERIGAKIREEAGELAQAIAAESDDRVASEAADVLYHVLVGLSSRGVPLRAVIEKLAARSGQSGHDEKAQRNAPARP
ncbi:MAG: bifunctional phosphoribosyl-AMP cyclohydrolase/phosphoribosyl-ATP diphosphatase HisIE [Minicystis sp.]